MMPRQSAALGPADERAGGACRPFWFLRDSAATPDASPDLRWDPLLVCVAGYILMAVGRAHQLFPALGALRPAVLTGLCAIALFLADRNEERRWRRLFEQPTGHVIALLAWMALSVPGALVTSNSFDLLFDNFIKTVLMYLVIVGCVRGARDVERLAIAYLAAAAVYATVVIFRFELGTGEAWRLGRLYYYDANDFATFAVSAMPFAAYLLHTPGRTHARVPAALALGLLALGFVYTGSRGGFIALVVMGGYMLVRYRGIPLRWRLTATALVALVVLATASDKYWQQMTTIVSDADYNRTEETGRIQIWRRGIGYMLENPLFGVGAANFQTAEGTLSQQAHRQQLGIGVRWNAAHNTFVQIGAELGIPGLALLLAIIAGAFRALRRATRIVPVGEAAPDIPHLAQSIAAALIGFLVGAFFLSLAYSEMLYTLVALAVGLQKAIGLAAADDGSTPQAAGFTR